MNEPEANESSLPGYPFPTALPGSLDSPPLFKLEDQPEMPKRTVRMWKPSAEEFLLDQDYAQLVVDLGESEMGNVQFELVDEMKGAEFGHTLIASVIPNPS